MCDALRELFEEDFKEREKLAEARGEQKVYLKLIQEGIFTIQDVTMRLQTSEEAIKSML